MTVSRFVLCGAIAVGMAALGCGESEPEPVEAAGPERLVAPAAGEGFQVSMEAVAPAFSEVWLCQIGKFPGEGTQMVHRAVSRQSDVMHHMDVMALALADVDIAPGIYDCAELYDQHAALMEEGVILYGAQAAEQEINLPDGVAAPVPGGTDLMHEIHYVNTTPNDVEVFSQLNAYTMDAEDVEDTIWGSVVRDTHLNIPPMTAHTEWTRCVMNEDIRLLFLSSHTHKLGRSVKIRSFDGTDAGEQMYENTNWESPALNDYSEDELIIKKGTGFEFSCDFNNGTTDMVNWGFNATDEMCQIALVYTPGDTGITCDVVESSDGVLDAWGD